jgi:hypothetical protein
MKSAQAYRAGAEEEGHKEERKEGIVLFLVIDEAKILMKMLDGEAIKCNFSNDVQILGKAGFNVIYDIKLRMS